MPAMMHRSMHGRQSRCERRSRQTGKQGQSNELASYFHFGNTVRREPDWWLAVF